MIKKKTYEISKISTCQKYIINCIYMATENITHIYKTNQDQFCLTRARPRL